jgi:hypothetical protein
MGKILCAAIDILKNGRMQTAISRRAKLVLADGIEGRRAKLSELLALYVKSL